MRTKIYNFLVNKQPGIKFRYHKMHDNATGTRKLLSWFYLLWLNFAYYFLFCRFLGKDPGVMIYEEKNLLIDIPESSTSPDVEAYIEKISAYEIISFDIFDTLIFRPFSEPTDLFYFVGQKLGYMDFKRIRMEAEREVRWKKYKKEESLEVTLAEIWTLLEEKTGIPAEMGMDIEMETELEFCYTNSFMWSVYEHLLKMEKKIVIVSDMYLPEAFLGKLLNHNGYYSFDKLYVSCEYNKNKGSGELFDVVKRDLHIQDGQMIHVGDNPRGDVQMPEKKKIHTCYYPNVNKNTLLYRPYDMSPVVGGAYRGIVNNHLYCGVHKDSMEFEYGYIYGGLFVLGYCEFIHQYCLKNQVDKILFLSRDGDILSRVYGMLYPEENMEYVYWSRKAATKLMAVCDRYDYFRRFLDHKINQELTLEDIFQSMEIEGLLEKLPFSLKRDSKLTTSNVKKVKYFLIEHWEEVLESYSEEHKAAKTYYAKVLDGFSKVVAVDIGWAGSGAIALHRLVNEVWNLSCDVIGMLAGTNTVHNAEPDASEMFLQSGQLVSYLYSLSHNRDLMKKHDLNKDFNVYWELLLSSPQPQFVGFEWQNGTPDFRFGKTDANPDGIKDVQKGIIKFIVDYKNHFGHIPYMLQISGRDAYAPMLLASSNHEAYLCAMKDRFDLVIGVE